MIINVTQKHINEGQTICIDNYKRSHTCPLSRAIQEATHYKDVSVTPHIITIRNDKGKRVFSSGVLPKKIKKFITHADTYRKPEEYKDKLKPFTFEI